MGDVVDELVVGDGVGVGGTVSEQRSYAGLVRLVVVSVVVVVVVMSHS